MYGCWSRGTRPGLVESSPAATATSGEARCMLAGGLQCDVEGRRWWGAGDGVDEQVGWRRGEAKVAVRILEWAGFHALEGSGMYVGVY